MMITINPTNLQFSNLNKTRNPYPNSHLQHTRSLKSSQISNTHEPILSSHSLVQQFNPNIPIQEALTPPSSWYTSPEFLSLEFDQVFFKGWQAVGCTAQVQEANSFFTGRLGNIEYVVCRDENGELRAFHNVCRHHASLLAFGSGKGTCFTCPYHGWTYGLNGALLKATKITGIKNFNVKEFGLVPLKVAIWGPFILLNLERESVTQQSCDEEVGMEWLGSSSGILSTNGVDNSLSYLCRHEYAIECNWKVWSLISLSPGMTCEILGFKLSGQGLHVIRVACCMNLRTRLVRCYVIQEDIGLRFVLQVFCDNYLDGGYHVPFAHKDLASGLKLDSYSTTVYEKVSIQRCDGGEVQDQEDFDRLGSKSLYAFIYPNFMVNRYGPWMDTNLVLPVGPRRCKVIFDYFLDASLKDDEAFVAKSLEDSKKVQMEDIMLCELVQRGLESPAYDSGRYAPMVEKAMHHFHCLLYENLIKSCYL